MLGEAKPGNIAFGRVKSAEGDAGLPARTRTANPVFKGDATLMQQLFRDLGRWHEEDGKRVFYLRAMPTNRASLKESLRALCDKTFGASAPQVTIEDGDDAHRDKIKVSVPSVLFTQQAQRIKMLLASIAQEVPHR